ncbi:MAG: hypothetical protein M3511_00645 [Deinococcota bacterium]|jgi:predicted nucleotide-binding protein (sugar kinase/HSP70/actin superfamily)|nr:hypothetical protein [Deinococcota bacterium]
MHRFDEQFMVREVNMKMRMNEARAATEYALWELKQCRSSIRQRLARTLIRLVKWLEPGSYPAPCERKRTYTESDAAL